MSPTIGLHASYIPEKSFCQRVFNVDNLKKLVALIAIVATIAIAISLSIFSCIGFSIGILPSIILSAVSIVSAIVLFLLLISTIQSGVSKQDLQTANELLREEISFLKLVNQGLGLDISTIQLQMKELKSQNTQIKEKLLFLYKAIHQTDTPPLDSETPGSPTESQSTFKKITNLFYKSE